MMKNKHIWYGFLYIVVAAKIVHAQTYPTISSAKVKTVVTHDSSQQMYYYNYSVCSDTVNTGNIIAFEVDISRYPTSMDFDTSGLVFEDSFVRSSFHRRYPSLRGKIVPVGFPHSPGIWHGGFSNALTAVFIGTAQLILPGDSLSGFVMTSKGLPGMRYCIVKPDFDVVALFPNPEEDTTFTAEQIDSIREATKFRGFTVGPYAPPEIFNGLTFLDTIKSYINQSRTLGWITNDPTANKYKRLIDTARFHLQANNRGVTKAKLDSVMVSVYPDSAAGLITSEAYALLRFNTEYLLKKLSEE
jgi:hypothetical protein